MKQALWSLIALGCISIGWWSGWYQDQHVDRLTVDGGIYITSGIPTATDRTIYEVDGALYWKGSLILTR